MSMDLCPLGNFNNLVIILYALIFEKDINKYSIKNSEHINYLFIYLCALSLIFYLFNMMTQGVITPLFIVIPSIKINSIPSSLL